MPDSDPDWEKVIMIVMGLFVAAVIWVCFINFT